METIKQKLTLDQQLTYRIRVPGHLDDRWLEWYDQLTITFKSADNGLSVTTLTGRFDQAALMGVLRRLYSLGLPLISVTCLDV